MENAKECYVCHRTMTYNDAFASIERLNAHMNAHDDNASRVDVDDDDVTTCSLCDIELVHCVGPDTQFVNGVVVVCASCIARARVDIYDAMYA